MRNHRLYLKDIFDAMESIEQFVQNMDFEDFKKDDKTVSAVIRKFEIIGEATKQIPDDIKQKSPEAPWKEMAGMRDRLIHSYFGVDYQMVWMTIKERLPKVKPYIKRIFEKEK
jgi:uncharacterized protein with HEPN domain